LDEEETEEIDSDETQETEELVLDEESQESPTETEEEPEELDELVLDDEQDIASKIESAVEELSDEDLQSEVDEDTLLDIVSGDLDSLTSRDIKLAVGEELLEEDSSEGDSDVTEIAEIDEEEIEIEEETQDGVTALKNLLEALNDKNVAASMKGMKISINITLGDS